MARLSSIVLLALIPFLVLAAEVEAPPPPADASPWGMIIFGLIFFGMIGGFGLFIWMKERTRRQDVNRS
ncbi:MAG: hypothetical protein ACT4P8_03560 [Betaproteobacteria bacterium]